MPIPDSVLALIKAEQKKQGGLFIPNDPAYLEKLSHHSEILVHQDNKGVLGYVFFYCNAIDKKASYITLIGTSERARGKGVGHGLLRHVLLVSRQRGFLCCQLEVRKDNARAFNFYKKIGFQIQEDRPDKYLMAIDTR